MRYLVYTVAVLAAAGVVYFVSTTDGPTAADPAAQVADSESNVSDAADDTVAAAVTDEGEYELVSLKVPEMHCPFACYPSVKETLEGQAGVAGVDLAEQKEEGTIDNPVVLIRASSDFDAAKAIEALAATGFDKSEVID